MVKAVAATLIAMTLAALVMGCGDQWSEQDSGTKAYLSGIDFVDAAHGWAVGDDGVILATDDGGATWQQQRAGASDSLYDVSFADSLHGWAVGWHVSGTTRDGGTPVTRSVILATDDGGSTWRRQEAASKVPLHHVTFVDASRGWAAGGSGTVVATTDGGATWRVDELPTEDDIYGLSFPDAIHGWAVSFNSELLGFDDDHPSGRWKVSNVIFATDDGGDSWTLLRPRTKYALCGVAFTDADHGWSVGEGGTILSTSDGGSTWTAQDSGTRSDLEDVAFADATHGWAAGKYGTIVATSDGGATWHVQDTGTERWLFDVEPASTARAWAVGRGGTILTNGEGPAR